MTALQLNAQIAHDLALIDDEGVLRRVAAYVRRMATKCKPQDDSLMTKEEFFARVDRGMEQIRNGQYKRFSDVESMNAYLNSL